MGGFTGEGLAVDVLQFISEVVCSGMDKDDKKKKIVVVGHCLGGRIAIIASSIYQQINGGAVPPSTLTTNHQLPDSANFEISHLILSECDTKIQQVKPSAIVTTHNNRRFNSRDEAKSSLIDCGYEMKVVVDMIARGLIYQEEEFGNSLDIISAIDDVPGLEALSLFSADAKPPPLSPTEPSHDTKTWWSDVNPEATTLAKINILSNAITKSSLILISSLPEHATILTAQKGKTQTDSRTINEMRRSLQGCDVICFECGIELFVEKEKAFLKLLNGVCNCLN